MKIFSSEDELLSVLEKHDQLILDCVSERIEFDKFLQDYDNFYMSYALDGHESDEEEKKKFEHYKNKIEPHKKVWELILSGRVGLRRKRCHGGVQGSRALWKR